MYKKQLRGLVYRCLIIFLLFLTACSSKITGENESNNILVQVFTDFIEENLSSYKNLPDDIYVSCLVLRDSSDTKIMSVYMSGGKPSINELPNKYFKIKKYYCFYYDKYLESDSTKMISDLKKEKLLIFDKNYYQKYWTGFSPWSIYIEKDNNGKYIYNRRFKKKKMFNDEDVW